MHFSVKCKSLCYFLERLAPKIGLKELHHNICNEILIIFRTLEHTSSFQRKIKQSAAIQVREVIENFIKETYRKNVGTTDN